MSRYYKWLLGLYPRKKIATFSTILIVLSSVFSFFSSFAWPHPSVLHLSGGVVANVLGQLGKLQVANRFRSLSLRQGTRMGMLGVATGTPLVDNLSATSRQDDMSSRPAPCNGKNSIWPRGLGEGTPAWTKSPRIIKS